MAILYAWEQSIDGVDLRIEYRHAFFSSGRLIVGDTTLVFRRMWGFSLVLDTAVQTSAGAVPVQVALRRPVRAAMGLIHPDRLIELSVRGDQCTPVLRRAPWLSLRPWWVRTLVVVSAFVCSAKIKALVPELPGGVLFVLLLWLTANWPASAADLATATNPASEASAPRVGEQGAPASS